MTFVLFHGSFGSPEGNWFPYVKDQLEKMRQRVIIPTFPVEDWNRITELGPKAEVHHQSLRHWFKTFMPFAESLIRENNLCFIGHSLGPLFILHVLSKWKIQLKNAIFVCPFLEDLHKDWQFYVVNKTFYKTNFNYHALKEQIPQSTVIYSSNDPYVENRYSIDFANHLRSGLVKIKNGGHLNNDSGYTTFPLVIDLCKKMIA